MSHMQNREFLRLLTNTRRGNCQGKLIELLCGSVIQYTVYSTVLQKEEVKDGRFPPTDLK